MLNFPGHRALAAARARAWSGVAQHDHAHDVPGKFGQVHFPPRAKPRSSRRSSARWPCCIPSPTRKQRRRSRRSPRTIRACGMAQWGVAMTYLHIIWAPPTEDEFTAGPSGGAESGGGCGAHPARTRLHRRDRHVSTRATRIAHPRACRLRKGDGGGGAALPRRRRGGDLLRALALPASPTTRRPTRRTRTRRRRRRSSTRSSQRSRPPRHRALHDPLLRLPGARRAGAAGGRARTRRSRPRRRTRCTCRRTSSPAWDVEPSRSNRTCLRSGRRRRAFASPRPGANAFDALHAMDYLEYAVPAERTGCQGASGGRRRRQGDQSRHSAVRRGVCAGGHPGPPCARAPCLEGCGVGQARDDDPLGEYPYARGDRSLRPFRGKRSCRRSGTSRQELATLAAIQTSLKGQKGFDWGDAGGSAAPGRRGLAGAGGEEGRGSADLAAIGGRSGGFRRTSIPSLLVDPSRTRAARGSARRAGEARGGARRVRGFAPDGAATPQQLQRRREGAGRAGKKQAAKAFRAQLVALCGGSVPSRAGAADGDRRVGLWRRRCSPSAGIIPVVKHRQLPTADRRTAERRRLAPLRDGAGDVQHSRCPAPRAIRGSTVAPTATPWWSVADTGSALPRAMCQPPRLAHADPSRGPPLTAVPREEEAHRPLGLARRPEIRHRSSARLSQACRKKLGEGFAAPTSSGLAMGTTSCSTPVSTQSGSSDTAPAGARPSASSSRVAATGRVAGPWRPRSVHDDPRRATSTSPAFISSVTRSRAPPTTFAVPSVGWPANGISNEGVRSDGRPLARRHTNVVSDRFICARTPASARRRARALLEHAQRIAREPIRPREDVDDPVCVRARRGGGHGCVMGVKSGWSRTRSSQART